METPQKTPAELFAAQALASQVKKELTENILPYWMGKMTNPDGGFYGRIDGLENLDPESPVGNIMTARMLWTFASAYRLLGNQELLRTRLLHRLKKQSLTLCTVRVSQSLVIF